MVKIKSVLLIILISFFFIGSIFILSPFPKQEFSVVELPNSFGIPINTGFEFQGKNQCAAFSTAFVLRNFGQIVKGSEVYSKLSYEVPISGYVLPKGIVTYIKSNGFNSMVFRGNLKTLKAKLVEGSNPLIVLVGNGLFWQHYMTFIGFDNQKGELYFYDSGKDKDENGELPGNRTMTNDYFLKWWDNGLPIFNHMYITAEKTL